MFRAGVQEAGGKILMNELWMPLAQIAFDNPALFECFGRVEEIAGNSIELNQWIDLGIPVRDLRSDPKIQELVDPIVRPVLDEIDGPLLADGSCNGLNSIVPAPVLHFLFGVVDGIEEWFKHAEIEIDGKPLKASTASADQKLQIQKRFTEIAKEIVAVFIGTRGISPRFIKRYGRDDVLFMVANVRMCDLIKTGRLVEWLIRCKGNDRVAVIEKSRREMLVYGERWQVMRYEAMATTGRKPRWADQKRQATTAGQPATRAASAESGSAARAQINQGSKSTAASPPASPRGAEKPDNPEPETRDGIASGSATASPPASPRSREQFRSPGKAMLFGSSSESATKSPPTSPGAAAEFRNAAKVKQIKHENALKRVAKVIQLERIHDPSLVRLLEEQIAKFERRTIKSERDLLSACLTIAQDQMQKAEDLGGMLNYEAIGLSVVLERALLKKDKKAIGTSATSVEPARPSKPALVKSKRAEQQTVLAKAEDRTAESNRVEKPEHQSDKSGNKSSRPDNKSAESRQPPSND